jgi:hypothetical protein
MKAEFETLTQRYLDGSLSAEEMTQLNRYLNDSGAARRDFVRQYIERYGVITARRLANVYKAHGFIGANHETANQDMQALGFFSTRSTGGRPRKAAL